MVTTVGEQKEFFNQRSVRDATLARKIKKLLFSPSDRDMFRIVDRRLCAYMLIDHKDLPKTNKTFGPDLNALKMKTISHKNPEVQV